MKILISEIIRQKCPEIKLGVITADIIFEKYNSELWKVIKLEQERIRKIAISDIKDIPQIKSSRDAYRNLGKEPARYRLSAEALHRRIIKGKDLYQINNVVDLINLSSIKTGYSIGGYDLDKIQDKIIFDTGKSDEKYIAIGRGALNIENLPVFKDNIGAFGSPTSDSERTKITEKTRKIMLIVINFANHIGFNEDLGMIKKLITKFLQGKNICTTTF